MPTLQTIGGYRIEMHTGREAPPPHVHVVSDRGDVVVNLLTLSPYGSQPFRLPKNVASYLEKHQAALLAKWDEYHAS